MQNGERERDGRTQITMKNRRNNMTKNVSVYIKRERRRGGYKETVGQAKSIKIARKK